LHPPSLLQATMSNPTNPAAAKSVSANANATIGKSHSGYIGRFAPSPTGPLHFGSVLAAVASYMDAKANNGLWLLRMEDLDPPREPAGAADQILQQLTQLGLHWDGEVLYQSQRLKNYAEALKELQDRQLCYRCDCSRSQIRNMGSVYDGRCRQRLTPASHEFAVRVKTDAKAIEFLDLIQGAHQHAIYTETGDFVIRRKDKLFAYQLAVVVDDEYQGITHVIRGFDLLDSTPRQIYLQQLLDYSTVVYGHIPIVINALGDKLSKQTFAPAADIQNSSRLLHQCLNFLGQAAPGALLNAEPQSLLAWGIEHWDIHAVPKLATIRQDAPK
jgi:glutamyl-Q tRNA(Asp) synthetase